MNTPELQQLKNAWLLAREAGDAQAQLNLLRDHPGELAAMSDFIAAYHATGAEEPIDFDVPALALTKRALSSAMDRVFAPVALASLAELRKSRHLSKVQVAQGLRLTIDVWNKFEAGAIEMVSLSQRQVERLAQFFQISADQFGNLLNGSQPAYTLNRRQSEEAAQEEHGPQKQTFAEALSRSTMSKEDKRFWLEQ
ncbi:MAG TPA: helix-turn-helix transcriptional regulator [Ktedonosporobacter sp.]|nr:helix-turn-helix transcriptional regulator [Ktedonosporobacter sp.]